MPPQQRGTKQLLFEFAPVILRERRPNQVSALGDFDKPGCLGQRLRCHTPAAAWFALVVVKRVCQIPLRISHQNLACFTRITGIPSNLKDKPVIYYLLGKIEMDARNGVAVKIESRFGRIALEQVMAHRANVFPLPFAELFALAQSRAVGRADVIVTPVAAARRKRNRGGR